MPDYRAVEGQLTHALSLNRRPVAVAFRAAPPPGVPKFIGIEPSGCSFWRLAAAERAFYTVPADHHNCPIGSYTHNISLPPERAVELPQTLSLMTELGYLKMEEVPGIPRLPESPGVVIYYTDLGEDELYVMIPGRDVARVAAEAQTIASANLKLSDYHRERRRALATE